MDGNKKLGTLHAPKCRIKHIGIGTFLQKLFEKGNRFALIASFTVLTMTRRDASAARILKNQAKMHDKELKGDFSQEALMTIIAIMKDNDDPKLQMAAAKVLLDRSAKPLTTQPPEVSPPTEDELDAAIALAKKVLDALAGTKTQELDGEGEVVIDGAPGTDNPTG